MFKYILKVEQLRLQSEVAFRTQKQHTGTAIHRASGSAIYFLCSEGNTVQCLSHSYLKQSSLDAESRQQGDGTEKVDLWGGDRLKAPWQWGKIRAFEICLSYVQHMYRIGTRRAKRTWWRIKSDTGELKKRHKGTPTVIRVKDNTLSVLRIWATYITNCHELCNDLHY